MIGNLSPVWKPITSTALLLGATRQKESWSRYSMGPLGFGVEVGITGVRVGGLRVAVGVTVG